jgi:small-conductance mechanosensitive channel
VDHHGAEWRVAGGLFLLFAVQVRRSGCGGLGHLRTERHRRACVPSYGACAASAPESPALINPAEQPLHLFGVTLIGFTPANGRKLLLTLALAIVAPGLAWILNKLIKALTPGTPNRAVSFWTRQGVSLVTAILVIVGVASIWFNDPGRLTSAVGLITAGVAVAMQRIITAIAGYFVILRGKVFNIGDRIVIGGVRGDVIDLGFMQTTVMEMGEARGEQPDSPAVWVHSRQYTGRIVTVSNSVIFDQPVYNYSRDFPYLFDEMKIPVRYQDDMAAVERILLEAAREHTTKVSDLEEKAIAELRRRYFLDQETPEPRVYWRLTDNWLELTLRFVVPDHGARRIKDAMSRSIMAGLQKAGIGIASATYDVVGMPELKVSLSPPK